VNIFLTEDKGYVKFQILIKPVVFILLVVGFFFFYNTFLVDRSIETLEYSLANIAIADTTGPVSSVAPLIQLQFLGELSLPDFNQENMVNLEYTSDVLATSMAERNSDDVKSTIEYTIKKKELRRNIVLRILDRINVFFKDQFMIVLALLRKKEPAPNIDPSIINKITRYENNGEFDQAIKLYTETIKKFSNYTEAPGLMLRLGYLLHKKGDFDEAQEIYREVLKKFPGTTEARSALKFIDKLSKKNAIRKKVEDLDSKIVIERDIRNQQKLYYEIGLLELSALDLKNARKNFAKAVAIQPDTNIAEQSYLRLGICERLLGNIDASLMAFNKILKIAKDYGLRMQAKYQISQIYKQKGDYEKGTAYLEKGLEGYEDKKIIPLLKFQLGSAHLLDLKDKAKAREIFEDLRLKFPGKELTYPGTNFVSKHLEMDIPAVMPKEMAEYMRKSWVENITPDRFLNLVDNAALRFTNFITEGITEIVLLEEYDVERGDYVDIDLTQKRLNNYIKKWFPPGNSSRVWDVQVKFKGKKKLEIFGTIYLADGRKIDGSIDGIFKMLKGPPRPYWKNIGKKRRKAKNFVAYYPKKSKLGGIPVPSQIMNIVLKPSIKHFNRDFPLDIEEFILDKDTILFGGPIREDIVASLEAEAYGLRHMEVKGEASGFIYGRRKESLGATGLEGKKEVTRSMDIGGLHN